MENKSIELRGVLYEIRELTANDMMKLWSNEGAEVGQLAMMKLAITADGDEIEDVGQLPAAVFVKLTAEFNAINGFDLGND